MGEARKRLVTVGVKRGILAISHIVTFSYVMMLVLNQIFFSFLKSLILAQNERWRRGLGMQVERERGNPSTAA